MKKVKISLVLNILIVAFTIFATISMFTGFRFMSDYVVLEVNKLEMFKFFTVDSNVLMGIISFIYIIFDIKLLKGTIKEIPKSVFLSKLVATSAVALTFTVVFGYLGFLTGYYYMILNSNLFFHLITPVLSIITFIFFEKGSISFKESLYGVLPTIIYAFFYVLNVIIHIDNGKVSPVYDWYYFVQGGISSAFIVVPLILLVSFLISFLLYKINSKLD